jgi:hypothetical protein
MAVNTTDADSDEDEHHPEGDDHGWAPEKDPEGWNEYSIERWGEVRPFFFPSTRRVYLSRSAAQSRADLIRHWGGEAEVIECTPQWRTVAEASRERRKRRIHDRIAKLQNVLAAEQAKYAEV